MENKMIIKRHLFVIAIIGICIGLIITSFGAYNFVDVLKKRTTANFEKVSGDGYYVQSAAFGTDYYTYTYNAAAETVDALSGLNYKASVINNNLIESIKVIYTINSAIYALITSIGLVMVFAFLILVSRCIKKNPNYQSCKKEEILSLDTAIDSAIDSPIKEVV